jgi:hypothetical protein
MCMDSELVVCREEVFSQHFFDKGNILISRDTNYTQPLQQCNTLMALRMHKAKKKL